MINGHFHVRSKPSRRAWQRHARDGVSGGEKLVVDSYTKSNGQEVVVSTWNLCVGHGGGVWSEGEEGGHGSSWSEV